VLIWEGLLGNIVSGTKSLSVQQYVVTITDWIAGTPLLDASVGRATAVVMTAVVTIGFTWLAIERMRSFSVAGETG
jgi:ABC-2 type transport system permease protein